MSGITIHPTLASISLAGAARSFPINDGKPALKALRGQVEAQSGSASSGAESDKDQARLKKTCQDFETVFLNYMLSKMRESVPKDDLLGDSNGEKIYQGMLDEELSKQIAAGGGVGLGSMLYRQLGGPKG